jgi:hypothetical protein
MVELRVLTGRQTGDNCVLRKFPARVGRSETSDFKIEEAGVWDRHFEIDLKPHGGFEVRACPQALLSMNGQPVTTAPLRNGDHIQAGVSTVRFSISPTTPGRQGHRELALWMGLVALTLTQLFLVRLMLY